MELNPERLLELERNDELFNCIWQLVLASAELEAALQVIGDSEPSKYQRVVLDALRAHVVQALKPFEKPKP